MAQQLSATMSGASVQQEAVLDETHVNTEDSIPLVHETMKGLHDVAIN